MNNTNTDETCVCGNPNCNFENAHNMVKNANNALNNIATPSEIMSRVSSVDTDEPEFSEEMKYEDGCGNNTTVIKNIQRTVDLDTKVNVTDATDEQQAMYKSMAELVEQNFETFVNKNQDYGNSYLDTTVGYSLDGPFNSQFEATVNGLLVRMNDKQQRLETLTFGADGRVKESLMDTTLDLANYALMLAYVIENMESDE